MTFFQQLQDLELFTYLREAPYAYPVLLSVHIVALAFFGGLILVTDLRLMGIGMKSCSVADLVDGLRVPKRFGFAVAATCGILLFGSKAKIYAPNPWLHAKLILFLLILLHHLLFRSTIYSAPAALDSNPNLAGRARLAGAVSLLLWMCLTVAGRGIGYINPF